MDKEKRDKKIVRSAVMLLLVLSILLSPLIGSALSEGEYDCPTANHKYVEIERVEATATKDGFVLYRCELCEWQWEEVLYATNHKWGEWVIDEAATCTETGTTTLSHTQ